MTNQNPAQGYEIGIFNQLVKNSEAIALTKFKVEESIKQSTDINNRLKKVEESVKEIPEIKAKVTDIDERLTNIEQIGQKLLKSVKYIIGAIALGIVINILSLPALNLFN